MRFGRTLKTSIYEPWKGAYIDYGRLKQLLREDSPDSDDQGWTEDDEGKFVEELVNVQLEKVNAFQAKTYQDLRDRTSECEAKLQRLKDSDSFVVKSTEGDGTQDKESGEGRDSADILNQLDSISTEISELEKYSRINYTGFLKAVKKHDRKRGSRYRVRPLLQVRLAALPFNSEDYSPLLYRFIDPGTCNIGADSNNRLSAMYSFARQSLDGNAERTKSMSSSRNGKDVYTSHKCMFISCTACIFSN